MSNRFSASVVVGVMALVVATAGCTNPPAGSAGPTAATSAAAGLPNPSPMALWPAPPDPLERTAAAGLVPETVEQLAYHVHAHLDVFVDDVPIVVPAGIGINISDPGVRTFNEPDGSVAYGGIQGCATPCISPLHTHDSTGIIHTESATAEGNTLGQLFTEWGVTLGESCVAEHCDPEPIAIYLNGEPFSGDPNAIELTDRLQIAIVIGTPPAVIPSTADFSRA